MNVNRDATLTVRDLLRAVSHNEVSLDTPIGVIVDGRVQGIAAHEVHTYSDGSKAFAFRRSSLEVAPCEGGQAEEIGFP